MLPCCRNYFLVLCPELSCQIVEALYSVLNVLLRRWDDNIKTDLLKIGREVVSWKLRRWISRFLVNFVDCKPEVVYQFFVRDVFLPSLWVSQCAHGSARTHSTHSHTHTPHTHAHTQHTHSHTHTRTLTHSTHTHTLHTHSHSHAHTHAHWHSHTHTPHTHSHSHTHTHTCTQSLKFKEQIRRLTTFSVCLIEHTAVKAGGGMKV
jgi:ABC-type Zn2+ transport system, periplasmic component/surface adhesin